MYRVAFGIRNLAGTRRLHARAAAAVAVAALVAGCGGDSDRERRASLTNAAYSVSDWRGCGGGYNGGSWDDAGKLYLLCGSPSTLVVYNANGGLDQQVPLGFYGHDVAPSPSGEFLYVATGGGPPRRLNRQAGGGYKVDTAWRPAAYTFGGAAKSPRGVFVATDGGGNIYLSDGAWSGNDTHTVVKYRPDGSVVGRPFGSWANSWSTGTFYWMLTGLAVSRDGSKVYTVEVGNNRVQRWDRQADETYAFASTFGGNAQNNADRGGYCNFNGWEGKFAAPYDVALDRAGDLYVMNTTCHQVLKFTAAGSYIAGWKVGSDATSPRPHGFAVAANGDVLIGESSKKVVRSGGAYPRDGGSAPPPTPPEPDPKPPAPDPKPPAPDPKPPVKPPDDPPCAGYDREIGADDCVQRKLNVAALSPQRVVRRRGLSLTTTCSTDCTITVRASVAGAGAGVRFRTVTLRLTGERARTFRLSFAGNGLAKATRALRRGRRVTASVSVSAKSRPGGIGIRPQSRRVRLR